MATLEKGQAERKRRRRVKREAPDFIRSFAELRLKDIFTFNRNHIENH